MVRTLARPQIITVGAAVVATIVCGNIAWGYWKRRQEEEEEANGKKNGGNEVMQEEEADICIYFGSQSGTAEGFSNEIEEEAKAHGLKATVVDLEDFSPEDFAKHKVVILVVATYGEGDPTDNAVDFFKWLQDSSLPEDTLQGVKFTVMGLGNRQYVNFNTAGKLADKHMQRLGAACIYPRGEGDDDQNIEEDFEQWKGNGLWPALQSAVGVSTDGLQQEQSSAEIGSLESTDQILAKLPLRGIVEDVSGAHVDPLVQVGGADVLGKWYFGACRAPVVVCNELRQVADEKLGKTTKHIDFDITNFPAFVWQTADNLEVLPRTPQHELEWFAQRLSVTHQLEKHITFIRAAGVDKVVRKPFPAPCLVREALELYCDLHAAPPKTAARRLAAFAKDPADREAVEKLLQDREAYQWLTGDKVHLSLREFFELYLKSAEIDVGTFLQVCPRQKSRPYTIASSSREDPKKIGICVSMVHEGGLPTMSSVIDGLGARGHPVPHAARYLDSIGEAAQQPRCFKGLCSSMLCTDVAVGQDLLIYARASSFRLPKKSSLPIIMIGAGTGVAPFRAFVREFMAEKGKRQKTILFFGCTNRDQDFLYKEEFNDALARQPPALKELVTAFSREQKEKIYVQNRLHDRAPEISQFISDGAYVYVCGAVAMGNTIREELTKIMGSEAHISRLQKEGRFVEELW